MSANDDLLKAARRACDAREGLEGDMHGRMAEVLEALDAAVTEAERQATMPPTRLFLSGTHTYAVLPVSKPVWDEIAGKLREADYHHAFDHDEGVIDMQGIGLQVDPDRIGRDPTHAEAEATAAMIGYPPVNAPNLLLSIRMELLNMRPDLNWRERHALVDRLDATHGLAKGLVEHANSDHQTIGAWTAEHFDQVLLALQSTQPQSAEATAAGMKFCCATAENLSNELARVRNVLQSVFDLERVREAWHRIMKSDDVPMPDSRAAVHFVDAVATGRFAKLETVADALAAAAPENVAQLYVKVAREAQRIMGNLRRAHPGMHDGDECSHDRYARDVCEGIYNDRTDENLKLTEALRAIDTVAGGGYSQEAKQVHAIVEGAIRQYGVDG